MPVPGQGQSEGAVLKHRARRIGLSDAKIARELGLYQKTVARVWRDGAQQRNLGVVRSHIMQCERDVLADLARLHVDLTASLAAALVCPEARPQVAA